MKRNPLQRIFSVKNDPLSAFFCDFICSCQKKAVPLHPLFKKHDPHGSSVRKPAKRLRTEKRSTIRSTIQAQSAQSCEY